jgi:P-type Cu+ transporter
MIEYRISISGMTCPHCVARVKKTALAIEGVEAIEVNLESGTALVSGGKPHQVIEAISAKGYPAKPIVEISDSCPSPINTVEDQNLSDSVAENYSNQLPSKATTNAAQQFVVQVDDMTCASCVVTVEKAILSVAGVTSASVNLIEKIALIEGGEKQSVVKTIIDHGYHAQLVSNKKPINTYQIRLESKDRPSAKIDTQEIKQTIFPLLEKHVDISKVSLRSDDIIDISTDKHPAIILLILKKAAYSAYLLEQYDDPAVEQDKQSQLEITHSWQRAAAAALVGGTIMVGKHLGILPELTSNISFNSSIDPQFFWFIIAAICLLTMWFSGKKYYLGAIKQAKHYSANMDTLVALGTSAAWLSSVMIIFKPDFIPGGGHLYLDASVMILAFLQFGHALEVHAKQTTSKSIASIIELAPKTAHLLIDDEELELPVSILRVGDQIKVRPGEQIPIDGIIISGSSKIDESMLTGEPIAVSKYTGDTILAGTINQSGSFVFTVTKLGNDTTLAHIILMVKQAQISKPKIARLVDQIASVFVPIVIVISLLTFVIWTIFGPEPQIAYALTTAIAVLVIACPCALGLATPIAIMVGTGKAAEFNILIKNSDALQTASSLSHIILDKTGTLTQGKPVLTDIIINPLLKTEMDKKSVLQLASSLESFSEHPLAGAILTAAKNLKIEQLNCHDFLSIQGRGIQAKIDQRLYLLGNSHFMQENNIIIPDEISNQILELSKQAATPVWIAGNGDLLGLIAIKDPLRDDTADAIKRIQKQGIAIVICSGDNHHTVQSVADELGIKQLHSEVKPEDKLAVIKQLQSQGFKVGMVGDGVNDAPALAQADTGFAIGSGTDVAIENADITLAGNSLTNVSTAIAISTATIRNIKQNLFGAFIYNLIGIPLAAGLFYPFTGWLLAPAFASAAMALSSVTVVINANRLRFFSDK